MRDIRTADRVTQRPQPSTVIPLPIAARPKRRSQTHGRQIRQNPTKIDRNSCPPARARAHEATASVSSPHRRHSRTHPRHSRTHPRHSRTHPRHSREGGNPSPPGRSRLDSTSFPHPPTSFPRRRESIAPRPQRIGRTARSRRPLAVVPTPLCRPLSWPRAGIEDASRRRPTARNISYHGSAAS